MPKTHQGDREDCVHIALRAWIDIGCTRRDQTERRYSVSTFARHSMKETDEPLQVPFERGFHIR